VYTKYKTAIPITQGANIIIGGIIFHGVACALLYLPLEPTRRKPKRTGEDANRPQSAIFRNIIAEKNRNRTISTGSLDGTVITKDNQLVPGNIPASGTATNLTKIEESAAEKAEEAQVSCWWTKSRLRYTTDDNELLRPIDVFQENVLETS
jgi:hypothetical protein